MKAILKSSRVRFSGLTLVELLVVIAIVGILASLVLPAVQEAREAGRRIDCASRLRQLATASLTFETTRRSFPPGMDQKLFSTAPVYRGSSLFVHLLPYLEQSHHQKIWDFEDPMNNTLGGAAAVTACVLPILLCPSDLPEFTVVEQQGRHYGLTSYGGNGGRRSFMPQESTADGMFHTTGVASEPELDQRATTIADVLDGTSNTLLLGERTHLDRNMQMFADQHWTESFKSVGWWAPAVGRRSIGHVTMSSLVPINYKLPFSPEQAAARSSPVDAAGLQIFVQRRWCAWGSNHEGGANFSFADGSTRFLDEELTLDVLEAVSTRAGGEIAVSAEF